MRFLIDTNILLYAANAASPFHSAERPFLHRQVWERTPWCLTWPIVYEFLRVSTHPRVFSHPLKAQQALAFLGVLLGCDEVVLLVPTGGHLEVLTAVVRETAHPGGNLFHDIHTAALMRENGVAEIITADTDFLQFKFLRVTNPLMRS